MAIQGVCRVFEGVSESVQGASGRRRHQTSSLAPSDPARALQGPVLEVVLRVRELVLEVLHLLLLQTLDLAP